MNHRLFWQGLGVACVVMTGTARAQPAPPGPAVEAPAPPPEAPPPPPIVEEAPAAPEPQTFDAIEVETEIKRSFRLLVFGDMNFGYSFGEVRDADGATQFEQFGVDRGVKNHHRGFGLAGTDFVLIGELSKNVHYLGEVNFQVARGESSDIELDAERMFLDYDFSERLGVQAGLFFTPIGYHNRKQYSRAWLSMSATVPALFEEEYGFVPTHTIGVQAYGSVPVGQGDLLYAASFGNGRAIDPTLNVYARDLEPSALTLGVEYQKRGIRESSFGVAGWYDRIDTFRVDDLGQSVDIRSGAASPVEVRELGVNAFLASDTEQLGVLLEYVLVRHDVIAGQVAPGQERATLHGVFAEMAYHATPTVHPYVRYDRIAVPAGGGPYYPLRLDGDTLGRFYVPGEDLINLGVAWDRTGSNRLKLEYSIALEGPRPLSSITLQTAFGIQ